MALKINDAPTEVSINSVMLYVWGDEGTGKSTFALSAPGPILVLHNSENLEGGVIERAAKVKTVREASFLEDFSELSKEAAKKRAEELWGDFVETFLHGLATYRTVIIDTHSDLYELVRYNHHGTLIQGGKQRTYGPINRNMRRLHTAFKMKGGINGPANLIVVGKSANEFVNDKATGRKYQKGFGDMGYLCNAGVRTEYDITGTKYGCTITKPWHAGEHLNKRLESSFATFPVLMSMIAPAAAKGTWDTCTDKETPA